jgi:hypothetical protein
VAAAIVYVALCQSVNIARIEIGRALFKRREAAR